MSTFLLNEIRESEYEEREEDDEGRREISNGNYGLSLKKVLDHSSKKNESYEYRKRKKH